MTSIFKYIQNADLLLVKTLPLHCVTKSLQVLGEGGAAIGDGQVWQQILEGDGISVLVEERPHNGHQMGERLRTATAKVVYYPSWPQVGTQLPQQEADLFPAQTEHSLEKAVELQIGHLEDLKRDERQVTLRALNEEPSCTLR